MLGIEVDALTTSELSDLVSDAILSGRKKIVANHNLHSLYLFHHDPQLRNFFRTADTVHVDGMSLVNLGRVLGYALLPKHRITYLDWLPQLMAQGEKRGWRFFYLGGGPGIAEEAARRLRLMHPSLVLQTYHGYFDRKGLENQEVLEYLAACRPDVLLVGMGMPIQEQWILENLEHIPAHVILTAGAFFDYIAGVIPVPPRWSGRFGVEWLFRLAAEPRRLWRRYLWEPWYVAGLVVGRWVRGHDARP